MSTAVPPPGSEPGDHPTGGPPPPDQPGDPAAGQPGGYGPPHGPGGYGPGGYGPGGYGPPPGTGGYGVPPYGQPPYPTAQYAGPAPLSPGEERTWAMLAHLGALGLLLFTGVLGFLAPLLVMAVKGGASGYVRRHAVAALNFQLTLLVVGIVGVVLGGVVAVVTLGLALIVLVPALIAYGIFALVVMVIASLRANEGVEYSYPLSFTFVR